MSTSSARRDAISSFVRYFLPFWVILACVKGIQSVFYPDPYIVSDTGEYIWAAETLRPNPYKPIGYSYFLALARLLGGPLTTVLLQATLRALSVQVLGEVLRRYVRWPRWAVLGTMLCIALDPLTLFLDHHLLSDGLFIAASTLALAATIGHVCAEREPSRWMWLSVGIGASLVALALRFVGLALPAALVVACIVYGGPGRLARVAAVAIPTVALVAWLCGQVEREYGVFRMTTFDGWTFAGNIGPIISVRPGDGDDVEDPELRLLTEYYATFPPDMLSENDADWHRWSSDSPGKRLLWAFFHPLRGGGDAADEFVRRYREESPSWHTTASRLFARYDNPYGYGRGQDQPYHHAYVLVNELLRTFARSWIAEHPVSYLRDYYLDSLVRVFTTGKLMNGGRYQMRKRADPVLDDFWPGEETLHWGPPHGDVVFALAPSMRWVLRLEWLIGFVLAGAALARSRLRVRDRVRTFGVATFAFALAFGAATALSHTMQARYVTPLVPWMVVSIAFGVFGPAQPWVRPDVFPRPSRRLRRVAVGVAAMGLAVVLFRVVGVMSEGARIDPDVAARRWFRANAIPAPSVVIEGAQRAKDWYRDLGDLRLIIVPIPTDVMGPSACDPLYDPRWFVDVDYAVVSSEFEDVPDSVSAPRASELRRHLASTWTELATFDAREHDGWAVHVYGRPSDDAADSTGGADDALAGLDDVPCGLTADFLSTIGRAAYRRGRPESAVELYESAVALCPDSEFARYDLGALYVDLERYADAVAMLERAVALDPRRTESHNNLGVARAHLGDVRGAAAAFAAALKLDPTNELARANLEIMQGLIDDGE